MAEGSTPAASTASGIVLDPETRERVVPSSRRADGSKEQRVRAGFVPQEDIGVFRSRRAEAAKSGGVPGAAPGAARSSNGNLGAQATAYLFGDVDTPARNPSPSPSPAAAPSPAPRPSTPPPKSTPTLASFESPGRSWDAVSDSDEDEEVARAFAALSVDRDEAFPPLGAKPAAGASGDKDKGDGGVKGVKKGAAAARLKGTAAVTELKSGTQPTPTTSAAAPVPAATPARSDAASWRRSPAPARAATTPKPQPKPHPIQGGRRGPIGLAHPPPIDDEAAAGAAGGEGGESGGDAVHARHPRGGGGSGGGRGGRGADRGGRGRGRGRGANPAPSPGRGAWRRNAEPGRADGDWRRPPSPDAPRAPRAPRGAAGSQGTPAKHTHPTSPPPAKERPRDPVRVRAGGTPADRVRNILMQNAAADRK